MAINIDISGGNPEYTINNWQEGIADSPELGFANMRNIEIGAIPGEVMPAYIPISCTQPPLSNVTYTVSVANPGIFTTSTAHGLTIKATIVFKNVGGNLPTGLSTHGAYDAGHTYVQGDTMEANGQIWYAIKGGTGNAYTDYAYWREAQFYVATTPLTTTFTVSRAYGGYYSPAGTSLQITDAGTGTNTFSTVNMKEPKNIVKQYLTVNALSIDPFSTDYFIFMQDGDGVIWCKHPSLNTFFTVQGNSCSGNGITTGLGAGLIIFKGTDGKNWLVACTGQYMEFLELNHFMLSGGIGDWIITPTDFDFNGGSSNSVHPGIVSIQDNRAYFCDNNYITYFYEIATKNFLPTDNTTYTVAHLALPQLATIVSIAELTSSIYVGDLNSNFIYSWDRNSDHPISALRVAENSIYRMINLDNTLYILAGNKGVIYTTQGFTVTVFKKLPEYLTLGAVDWGGFDKINGHIILGAMGHDLTGITTGTNAGTYKVFLHSLEKGTLTCDSTASDQSLTTKITALLSTGADSYFAGTWAPASLSWPASLGGMDRVVPANGRYYTLTGPGITPDAYIETALIQVSDVQSTRSFEKIGIELARTLATGESIEIWWRETPAESYALLAIFDVAGTVNEYQPASISDVNAIQLKIRVNAVNANKIQSPRLKTVILK